jgi:serine/threonine-protein kinase
MGEVYRARDSRLGREVAIKALPAAFAQDRERLARFEREAKLLASLSHPNIAAIYGLEEEHGHRYLVMELVRGETLAERVGPGAPPVSETLEIARQIAEGLEAAHERGIVHRDLKPSNIQIAPDGLVKILDFGLARAFEPDSSEVANDLSRSPTISERMTGTGIILGTAAYMSPEQARGKAVDKRSDIWAFGVTLYETLSGRRLFTGETVSDTLAAVLKTDPDWNALPADTPVSIRRLLARCLDRDPKHRLHDIADARVEIEDAIQGLRGPSREMSLAVAPAPALPPARRGNALRLLAVAAAVAAAFALGLWSGSRGGPARAAPVIRTTVPLPAGTSLAGWASPIVALSADGRNVAFVTQEDNGTTHLYVQHLDRNDAQLVPGSENAEGPFFSPDGEWVAFAVEVSGRSARPGELKKYSLATGLTQTICGIGDYFGGFWSRDGSILFVNVQPKGIWKVSANGGRAEAVIPTFRINGRDSTRAVAWPQPLPDGKSFLLTDWNPSGLGDVWILDPATRELKSLGFSTLWARYVPTGHLLSVSGDGVLTASPFDPERREVTGPSVAIAKDLALGNGAPAAAFSETGLFAFATGYLRGSGRELLKLVRIAKGGAVTPLPFDADTFGRFPRLSPDGKRIAVNTRDGTMWIYDLSRNTRTRLLMEKVPGTDWPLWSPDGTRLVFAGAMPGEAGWRIYWQRVDGSDEPEVLVGGEEEKHPGSFTPDGSGLLYAGGEEDEWQIRLKPISGKGDPRLILKGSPDDPVVSPDGRLIAYESGETGVIEIFLRSFPGLEGKTQVSAGGGGRPRWSRDGRRLTYRSGDRFFSVAVSPGPKFDVAAPELLFEVPGIRGYDVAPDGSGIFALWRPPDSGIQKEIKLVVNWFEELERLAPSGKKR